MFDVNMMFRNEEAGNLTSSASAALTFPPDLTALTYMLHIPQSEASTGLKATIDTSDDGETYEETLELLDTGGSVGTGYSTGSAANGRAGTFYGSLKTPKKYRRLNVTVYGTCSVAGFGEVVCGVVAAGEDNKY